MAAGGGGLASPSLGPNSLYLEKEAVGSDDLSVPKLWHFLTVILPDINPVRSQMVFSSALCLAQGLTPKSADKKARTAETGQL